MGKRTPLDAADVATRLAVREGWSGDSARIAKSYVVDYHDGVRLIAEVAEVAKELEHHPDVELHWREVRFSMTTYSAGGVVTELDFELADAIDTIVNV
ncbi:4a-hydroxytetrahydrobiopterin dehydratase [Embleya hyalina]|uniref:Putative pterin-4-alpha-carbinolamine dehydratase n=1 Tax=Embleya hyalina TaxID=516124 RepID=A0A401YFB0_9ACTN|nr:4a-hydroxytetrahydrobiopterin dehydratase [Embleya hyalina]GCD93283.1 putative pterin-4-alpha-carbinolamine dehydratase [Embleya hyalina]